MLIKKEIKPITDILGYAVLDSQRFEYNLSFLMLLANENLNLWSKEHDDLIDEFMLNLSKKTIGNLINNLKKYLNLPEEFEEQLKEGLNARNYLIHKFFNDQAENLLTIEGRKIALEKIKSKREILVNTIINLDPLIEVIMKIKGFDSNMFNVSDKFEIN